MVGSVHVYSVLDALGALVLEILASLGTEMLKTRERTLYHIPLNVMVRFLGNTNQTAIIIQRIKYFGVCNPRKRRTSHLEHSADQVSCCSSGMDGIQPLLCTVSPNVSTVSEPQDWEHENGEEPVCRNACKKGPRNTETCRTPTQCRWRYIQWCRLPDGRCRSKQNASKRFNISNPT